MAFNSEVSVKPISKVDVAYKVYIPASVREVVDIEPEEELKVLVDGENQEIKLVKK